MTPSRERIVTARIALMFRFPFYGIVATRLGLEVDNTMPTMATNGRTIFYNEKFVEDMDDQETMFVVCHEILHAVLDHISRAKYNGHNHIIGNIAADFVVNAIAIEEKVGKPPFGGNYITKDMMDKGNKPTSSALFYDKKYSGWSYDAVYEDLIQNAEQYEKYVGACLDDHILLDDDPNMTEAEKAEIRATIREAILSAATAAGAGNVPAGVKRLIGDLTEPKMDWRQYLTETVESQITSDQTYARLGRRTFSSDIIYPRMTKADRVSVVLALDLSGSIGEVDVRDFFSEVQGICQQYASYEISIMTFDTKAYNLQSFTEDNIDELNDYELIGGGGTDFSGIFDLLKEEDVVPRQLVVFTDGEVYNWGDAEYCNTMFLIKNHRDIQAPYGTTFKYE